MNEEEAFHAKTAIYSVMEMLFEYGMVDDYDGEQLDILIDDLITK